MIPSPIEQFNKLMTQPIYSKQGEEQYLDIRYVFKVSHSPGNKNHLKQVLESYLESKGVQLENEEHRIDIL